MSGTSYPAIEKEGLLPAVDALEALLVSQVPNGVRRWETLTIRALLWHMLRHAGRTFLFPRWIDSDSGHPELLHVAARALMAYAVTREKDGAS
jgi:hypothetical protein